MSDMRHSPWVLKDATSVGRGDWKRSNISVSLNKTEKENAMVWFRSQWN